MGIITNEIISNLRDYVTTQNDIIEQIAQGESWDDLLKGYPELNKEDIKAALLYASASIENTEVRAANA